MNQNIPLIKGNNGVCGSSELEKFMTFREGNGSPAKYVYMGRSKYPVFVKKDFEYIEGVECHYIIRDISEMGANYYYQENVGNLIQLAIYSNIAKRDRDDVLIVVETCGSRAAMVTVIFLGKIIEPECIIMAKDVGIVIDVLSMSDMPKYSIKKEIDEDGVKMYMKKIDRETFSEMQTYKYPKSYSKDYYTNLMNMEMKHSIKRIHKDLPPSSNNVIENGDELCVVVGHVKDPFTVPSTEPPDIELSLRGEVI